MPKQKSVQAQIREALHGVIDTFSWKDGQAVVRRGFYFSHGMTAEKFGRAIVANLNTRGHIRGYSNEKLGFELVETGEVWKAFRGDAPVAQQSHWWARIKINFPEV